MARRVRPRANPYLSRRVRSRANPYFVASRKAPHPGLDCRRLNYSWLNTGVSDLDADVARNTHGTVSQDLLVFRVE